MNSQTWKFVACLRMACVRALLLALSRLSLRTLTKIMLAALDPQIRKMWMQRRRNRPWLHAPVSKLGSVVVRQTVAREE
jgi:hypothetical protein